MQHRLKLSSLALFTANLTPLAGVLLLGYSVSNIIVLYWFENIVIGLVNVARMIAFSPADPSRALVPGMSRRGASVSPAGPGRLRSGIMIQGLKLFLVPFFVLHYFFFCAGHGVFVFSLFPDQNGYFPRVDGIDLLGALARAIEIFSTPLAFAAAVLAASHVVSFFLNYLGGGEYRRFDVGQLMVMPYRRIVVLHVTIILGGFATQAFGEPIWLIVTLVAVKIAVDLQMHLKEHRNAAALPAKAQAAASASDAPRSEIEQVMAD